jgi:hypothetical protein
MYTDRKMKWFIGGIITIAVIMFTVLVINNDSYGHDYRHSDHHYMNQGHYMGNFDGDYCPMYTSDEYRKLIEKQKKEREAFLKEQKTKKVEVK